MTVQTPRITELQWAQLKAIRALNQEGEIATTDGIWRAVKDDSELFRRKPLVPISPASTEDGTLKRRHGVALRCLKYVGFVIDITRNCEWRLTQTGGECAADRRVFERRSTTFDESDDLARIRRQAGRHDNTPRFPPVKTPLGVDRASPALLLLLKAPAARPTG